MDKMKYKINRFRKLCIEHFNFVPKVEVINKGFNILVPEGSRLVRKIRGKSKSLYAYRTGLKEFKVQLYSAVYDEEVWFKLDGDFVDMLNFTSELTKCSFRWFSWNYLDEPKSLESLI